jgi:hypothetical protein
MSAQQVVFQYLSAGSNTLTVPGGFSNQVLVYAWGAGGGSGFNGPAGGGGGFVQGIVTVSSGDTVVISVGGQGGVGPRDGSGIGGIGDTPTISFNGGTTGVAAPTDHNDDQNYGAGGGGGAATSVLVNGVPMIVAAGGGGGGGGRSYQTGSPGLAGGVATLTSTTPRGGTSPGGYSVGGAGGGGYPFGGAGGQTFGDDAGAATGGYGGQNYANASVTSSTLTAGSGITPGGVTNALYPKAKRGYAGYDGAVIVIFTKSFQAYVKDTDWKSITNAYVKVGATTITAPTTTTSTTNYSANPSTLVDLLPQINSALAGTASSFPSTLWITFSPNLLNLLRDQGVSVTSFSSDIRTKLGNDLIIGVGGTGVYSSSEESQTSVTVGDTTYTRGSLAYTGTIAIPFSIPSTFTWNSTVRVYNFSATTSSTGPAVTRTIEGGWKQISRAWIKADDVWKPIQSGVSLVPITSTAEVVTINLTIAANANNYVLSDFLSATSYYPGRSIVNLTVDAGVIVGSGTVGTPALIIDGLVSGDLLNLTNNGNIAGAGGQGGAAGSYTSVTSGGSKAPSKGSGISSKGGYSAGTTTVTSIPGRPGEVGGPALYVTYATNLVNNGTIAGGGGGGGGGGGPTGGSGGGGAGRKAGSGANNGTLTAGGAGAGLGGAGGARGSAGSAGTNNNSAGGVGGSPGAAILGIDKVTITTEGTILGERRV